MRSITAQEMFQVVRWVDPERDPRVGFLLQLTTLTSDSPVEPWLAQIAEDAGLSQARPGWHYQALRLHRFFEALVAAESKPDAPAFGSGAILVYPRPLLRLCRARLYYGEGDLAVLRRLERRLVRYVNRRKRAPHRRWLGWAARFRRSSWVSRRRKAPMNRLPSFRPSV